MLPVSSTAAFGLYGTVGRNDFFLVDDKINSSSSVIEAWNSRVELRARPQSIVFPWTLIDTVPFLP